MPYYTNHPQWLVCARRFTRTGVYILACAFISIPLNNNLYAAEGSKSDNEVRQYTFSWKFEPQGNLAPRGGTTRGPNIELAEQPSDAWRALTEPDLSKKTRDRRAILAMAGPYRASFDFIETIGFTNGYTPSAPYQSWGTEYVYVVAEEADFISLQHILVMFIELPDGEISEPMVVKHWRQDWHYQNRQLVSFTGHSSWSSDRLTRSQAKGTWTQMVYQVDDSPRYGSYGTWVHTDNYSSWESAETARPLPRREFSVRNDYHMLVGRNRHTITPTGWVHQEENKKVVLTPDGSYAGPTSILAVETGLNRYERINNFDWSAGDRYWRETGAFWRLVRNAWQALFDEHNRVTLLPSEGTGTLFMDMFALADKYSGDKFDPKSAAADINATLEKHRQLKR